MISAISWVPKGASKPEPAVAELPSKDEIDEMIKTGVLERDEDDGTEEENEDMDAETEKQPSEVAQALAVADALGKSGTQMDDLTDGLKELDMEHYDDEDDGIELFSKGLGDLYYPSNEMDPYLKDQDDDDSEEIEDMTIRPVDSVIVCARNEDDVWIYEDTDDGDSNMFVHHDIIISEFPLSTAWLDCPLKGGEKGNFLAVGSMDPAIEIWDLDTIDEVQPCVVLGGKVDKKKTKKGKKKSKYKEGSHTGPVLGLAWNKEYRLFNLPGISLLVVVLTNKLRFGMWLLENVQAVAWNHHAPQVLLSGSFDHSVVMKDGRVPSHSGFKWSVTAEVECLAWDPHTEYSFVVSLEDGTIRGYDIRAAKSDPSSESKPSFTLHAHDKAACTLSYNPVAPNLLATGSMDKMVKLWDLSNNQPSCVSSRNPKAGAVFSISFSQDNPFLLAIGGSKGKLGVWDTLTDAGVSAKFGQYNQPNKPKS
ncbi:hypothetical protein COLO4_35734 [Corchorus olitorius]|uniref:Uncharacterized protein n=1 Tax=Corchorus olitorius TaxID=93759 RepID=A0A1R3GDQ9_9ROSI|nr:hypothetical protein COLO4_35734 [Corchorus olitorius]